LKNSESVLYFLILSLVSDIKNAALGSLLFAQCSMLFALCSLLNAQCSLLFALCSFAQKT